jgi:hypothetical protein
MPDMIDAFGMTLDSIPSSRARRTRSVCVVALSNETVRHKLGKAHNRNIPKGVSDHEKSYIDLVRIGKNVVATSLDELSVGFNNFTSIESFLLKRSIVN